MPVPAAVGSEWEVRVEGIMEGQKTVNVWHFTCVGATSDVELNLILVLLNCFVTHLMPVLSSSWSLVRVVWKQVSPTLGLEQVTIPEEAGPAAGSAVALPSYCSAVLSLRTIRAGRSGRGRKYIPGIPEAATIGSKFDTTHAFWTALVAFAACVLADFVHPDPAGGTDIFDLDVYSRKIGGSTYPFGASGFANVTQIVPDEVIGTTRSRKLGRGA